MLRGIEDHLWHEMCHLRRESFRAVTFVIVRPEGSPAWRDLWAARRRYAEAVDRWNAFYDASIA